MWIKHTLMTLKECVIANWLITDLEWLIVLLWMASYHSDSHESDEGYMILMTHWGNTEFTAIVSVIVCAWWNDAAKPMMETHTVFWETNYKDLITLCWLLTKNNLF